MEKKKVALITGITGQDGSYLAEYLLELGYEVHGTVRRVALEDPQNRLSRILHIKDKITLHSASLESFPSFFKVFQEIQPDECYHLAAQSFVSYSFEDEFSTMNTNINGTHFILSSLKNICPTCKYYFAGTSEMFGKVEKIPQDETTRFHPRSIYGISKVAGYELTRNYREAYDIFACTGILFNHESPRRGYEFVTRKITSVAAQIKLGLANEIRLGNIEAKRDWGFAGDYVKAMHLMLQQESPEDYVIGTGETHSVKEFLEVCFGHLGLNYEDYLVIDPLFYRPAEVNLLIGDPAKAKKELGWETKVSFEELVKMMVDHDLEWQSRIHDLHKKAA
ncbi:MAG: GDP-mannose 4,6-dehydratase [Halobacteriovoraceae bacterium]|jgi:GDPmannose 4,6-dehydratase|nr:GDP-mannose 4,6-dehydratase [Halobacteriovoraceae bacterium]